MEVSVVAEKSFDLKALAQMDIKDVAKLFKKNQTATKRTVKKQTTKSLTKPVVVFDFGTESVKVAVGRQVRTELKVMQLFTVQLPKGTIVDGKIIEPQILQDTLEVALTEQKVKVKDAIACVNSTQIITRELFIPVVEEDEIETVARYEIQQFLPINLEDYQVQYLIMDEVVVNTEKKYKLNVVAFLDKMAMSYYDVLKALGLKPYALDVSFNAVGKLAALEDVKLAQEGTVAFVDMGAQSIDVNIYQNKQVQFTRMIKTGGTIIDQNLNQMDMSLKSAVSYKMSQADLNDDMTEDVAARIVRYSVDEMLTELERVFQFYRNKSVGNTIDKLYVFGGTSHLNGMLPYIEARFNIPTATIQEFKKIELAPTVDKAVDVSDYTNSLGAMIRY